VGAWASKTYEINLRRCFDSVLPEPALTPVTPRMGGSHLNETAVTKCRGLTGQGEQSSD